MLKRTYRQILIVLAFIATVLVILPNLKLGNISRRISSASNFINFLSNVIRPGCQVKQINPFAKEVMAYMLDVGEVKCPKQDGLNINISANGFSVSTQGILSVRTRNITDDNINGYRFGHVWSLMDIPLVPSGSRLRRNHSGTIRNLASNVCVVPAPYDHVNPPSEIELIFSSNCGQPEADFTFTSGGLIKHNLTSKCIEPKEGSANPTPNTILVISARCEIQFDVIDGLVLHMVNTTSCIHNFGAGDKPYEGQKLCLWPSCSKLPRLTYEWFAVSAVIPKEVNTQHTFTSDMNHVQIRFENEKMVDKYVLSLIPKPMPPVKSSSRPNIVILCIEEASAAHFKRKLDLTSEIMYMMGGIEYKKHAAVAPSSPLNFNAMLNGNSIFRLAKEHNYVSMLNADDPSIVAGIGNDLGIEHNSLPFFRVLKKNYDIQAQGLCASGEPIHDVAFDYVSNFLGSYPSHGKLAVTVLSGICGTNFNFLSYMDKNMMHLLNQIRLLKNTIVFIQTLKGVDYGGIAKRKQGEDEMKRPLLYAYVSNDIRDEYKLEPTRSDQLSTPFDIYVTLHHLISQENLMHPHGKSFLQTSEPRNCAQTAIDPVMCPCI